ncbi:MAG TPA: hypothetical protein VGC88_04940 [Terriglobales bacterium]|jgi:hypothetical protein
MLLAFKFALGILAGFAAVVLWLWDKFEWLGVIDSVFARHRRDAKRDAHER